MSHFSQLIYVAIECNVDLKFVAKSFNSQPFYLEKHNLPHFLAVDLVKCFIGLNLILFSSCSILDSAQSKALTISRHHVSWAC